jgi:hypothetical protein
MKLGKVKHPSLRSMPLTSPKISPKAGLEATPTQNGGRAACQCARDVRVEIIPAFHKEHSQWNGFVFASVFFW